MPVRRFTLVPWMRGVPEVALLSVIFGIFLGIPLLLSSNTVLTSTTLIFYIVLWLIATFGHGDDISEDSIKSIKGSDSAVAVFVGIIAFIATEGLFALKLAILETTPVTPTPMKGWEVLLFNMAFVISAEELVFRDTAPYYLTIIFMKISKKMDEVIATTFAVIISSIGFGVFHMVAYKGDYIAISKAIVVGFLFGVIRMKWGILASYTAHFMFNIINIMGALSIGVLAFL